MATPIPIPPKKRTPGVFPEADKAELADMKIELALLRYQLLLERSARWLPSPKKDKKARKEPRREGQ